jgi:glycosyltransferase involved in cell wall biosynthesis
MRVAILTANARAGDAIGNQVAEKLAFFRERGADVCVFAECRRFLHPAVRPFCRPIDPQKPDGKAWQFLTSADLIVVEYGHAYPLLNLLPMLVGGKARIVLDYHGVSPPRLWPGAQRDMLEAGLRQRGLVWCADAAVVHSRFTRHELLEPTHFPRERCAIVPLPVDTTFFCPGPRGESWRRHLGLEDATVLLFVGRLAPNKRVPILIEALDRLRGRTPSVHAVIVGDDGDVYQLEKRRCQEHAATLGLADRVHFLGQVSPEQLRTAYRSANVFVMPSQHEGFCVPVVEAMACGLPVVAARAGALAETVGAAGLTFQPDDADDLARQLERVLDSRCSTDGPSPCRANNPLRVAVVAARYGSGFAGGAEKSLRTIAETLHQAGHEVELFTIHDPRDVAREMGGVPVRRFRADDCDSERFQAAARAITQAAGAVADDVEQECLRHSVRSAALLAALRERHWDAIITGPYLSGLSYDVARAFPSRTLLVPCFHDEPLARLRVWRSAYEQVGGMLFHSPEEQTLAEAEFGFNCPSSICAGTLLPVELGDAERGRQHIGTDKRYLVYCGRYLAEKGLPVLLEYTARYDTEHPGRFTFAFMGQGNVPIPAVSWACDLGFVPEAVKHNVLAGADALVHLSRNESLSLAVLEALAQGVPVLVEARCEVLAGHLSRCGAGKVIDSYEDFVAALNDLWENPARWRTLGRQGQEYVRARFGSRTVYQQTLEEAIRMLPLPLAERMRRCGLKRATEFGRPRWRERFAALIETLLDQPPRAYQPHLEVQPRTKTRHVSGAEGTVLIPVRVHNRGTHPAVAEGPARLVLRARVIDPASGATATESETRLPSLLMPGQALTVAIPVKVPQPMGSYDVLFEADVHKKSLVAGRMRLMVGFTNGMQPVGLEGVGNALAEVQRLQQLPDSYPDVTQGWLAAWKAWIKRKLLGNFKHAYVDVLSRQQSAVNRQLLSILQELVEYCTMLESMRRHERDRVRALEERLAQLDNGSRAGVGGRDLEPAARSRRSRRRESA